MPEYYAIYRARIGNPQSCPARYYDRDYGRAEVQGCSGDHYATFVRFLGELTDEQLELLIKYGEEEGLKICVSEDWIAEQKKHGIVFLMSRSDYDTFGVSVNDAIKIDLKRALRRYSQAVDDDEVDARVFEPLAFCFNRADGIRKPTESQRLEVIAPQPPDAEAKKIVAPANVNVNNMDDMRIAVYEGNIMSSIVSEIERWHVLSKTKYNNAGWAEIARAELERKVQKNIRNSYGKEDVSCTV